MVAWRELRDAALKAFEAADVDLAAQKQKIDDHHQSLIWKHEDRWESDLQLAKEIAAENPERATQEMNQALDRLQLGFAVVGLAPGVGIFADVLDATISAGRGNYG